MLIFEFSLKIVGKIGKQRRLRSQMLANRNSVADPWHFGVDPDVDPAILVIDLQEADKKLIFLKKFFCLLFFKVHFYIIFQR